MCYRAKSTYKNIPSAFAGLSCLYYRLYALVIHAYRQYLDVQRTGAWVEQQDVCRDGKAHTFCENRRRAASSQGGPQIACKDVDVLGNTLDKFEGYGAMAGLRTRRKTRRRRRRGHIRAEVPPLGRRQDVWPSGRRSSPS